MNFVQKSRFRGATRLTTTTTMEGTCETPKILDSISRSQRSNPHLKGSTNPRPASKSVLFNKDGFMEWHPQNHREFSGFIRAQRDRRHHEWSNPKQVEREEAHLRLSVLKATHYLHRSLKNMRCLSNMMIQLATLMTGNNPTFISTDLEHVLEPELSPHQLEGRRESRADREPNRRHVPKEEEWTQVKGRRYGANASMRNDRRRRPRRFHPGTRECPEGEAPAPIINQTDAGQRASPVMMEVSDE